jgi:hypothetical protein
MNLKSKKRRVCVIDGRLTRSRIDEKSQSGILEGLMEKDYQISRLWIRIAS